MRGLGSPTGAITIPLAPATSSTRPSPFSPSGKIEMVNAAWDDQGIKSLKPYEATHPPGGSFRLTFGRCAVDTQGHTVNNPLLFEQVSENTCG